MAGFQNLGYLLDLLVLVSLDVDPFSFEEPFEEPPFFEESLDFADSLESLSDPFVPEVDVPVLTDDFLLSVE